MLDWAQDGGLINLGDRNPGFSDVDEQKSATIEDMMESVHVSEAIQPEKRVASLKKRKTLVAKKPSSKISAAKKYDAPALSNLVNLLILRKKPFQSLPIHNSPLKPITAALYTLIKL
jgi:hypothetical protein